jgi:hypothetical protein
MACKAINPQKTKKHEKKCHFFARQPRFFCQKGPFWGRFQLSNFLLIRKWLAMWRLRGFKKRVTEKKCCQEQAGLPA